MSHVACKYTIGRSTICDIVLADDSMSRVHAELAFPEDGKLLVPDCWDYCVPDLQGKNSKWTFILESPHHDELRLGYPAAGDSGTIMAEVLFDQSKPFGLLLQENAPTVASYSVMNASCIPLQLECYREQNFKQVIFELSNARHSVQGVSAAKTTIKCALNSPIGNRITRNLKLRVMRQLEVNEHEVFIVCGVVAQAIFETAMSAKGRFHKPIVLNLGGKEAKVFYENHPSVRSGGTQSKWKDTENMKPLFALLGR